jgi:hypothetical protein
MVIYLEAIQILIYQPEALGIGWEKWFTFLNFNVFNALRPLTLTNFFLN